MLAFEGDACRCCSFEACMVGTDGRVCDTLGMVKERIVRMQQKYGVTAVYVATDSATAVSHLAAGLPEGLTVLHNVIEKDLAALSPKDFPVYDGDNEDHSMFYELRIAEGDLNPATMALSAIADVQLLSECDALVLTDSLFSHVAFLLAYGRQGVLPPFDVMGGSNEEWLPVRCTAQLIHVLPVLIMIPPVVYRGSSATCQTRTSALRRNMSTRGPMNTARRALWRAAPSDSWQQQWHRGHCHNSMCPLSVSGLPARGHCPCAVGSQCKCQHHHIQVSHFAVVACGGAGVSAGLPSCLASSRSFLV
jgi:hypothetical protein